MNPGKWWRAALSRNYHIYAVIALAFLFHALTIRGGHPWNGDFALNVMHAINIATGHPYSDTGYVYNPYVPLLSPGAYPPIFPLFLAPVYKIFGLDLHAMKVAGLVGFSVFLLVFHRYAVTRLDSGLARFAVVTLMAFSPWVWNLKNQILPDFLFMLSIYAAVLYVDRQYAVDRIKSNNYLQAATTGLLVYLSYATRVLGVLLVPAILVMDILKARTIRRSSLAVIAVFAAFYFAQGAWFGTGPSYLGSYVDNLEINQQQVAGRVVNEVVVTRIDPGRVLRDTAAIIIEHIDEYQNTMASYWSSGISKIFDKSLYFVTGLLAVAGFIGLLQARPSSGDFFLIFYVLALLVVPFLQDRYLLPLIPLYLIYIFRGLEYVQATRYLRGRAWLSVGALLVTMATYAGNYKQINFDDFVQGVEKKQSTEMFQFIRSQTPQDSLVVFRDPRILSLYTGRRSMIYYWADDPFALRDYLLQKGASFVVLDKVSSGIPDDDYLFKWVERCAENLTPVFENEDFRVYRFSG